MRADKGGPPTSRTIEPGDLLLLDFSVVVSGYRGDFTNTFAVGGGPTPRQRELFEACIGAFPAGEARLKPGTPARAVDAAVRGHFASLGLEHAFTLALRPRPRASATPSRPTSSPRATKPSRPATSSRSSPASTSRAIGGMRYERNYLITADGHETLSNHELRIDQ